MAKLARLAEDDPSRQQEIQTQLEAAAMIATQLRDDGGLRAAPKPSDSGVMYVSGLTLSRRQAPPVVLAEGGRFRIRGRMQQPTGFQVGLGVGDVELLGPEEKGTSR